MLGRSAGVSPAEQNKYSIDSLMPARRRRSGQPQKKDIPGVLRQPLQSRCARDGRAGHTKIHKYAVSGGDTGALCRL
jgi:hypothetical protein